MQDQGDQAQLAWVYERQVLIREWERLCMLSAWTLLKPCTLASHRVLLQEIIIHGLDECTGLDDWAQRVLVRKNQSTNLIVFRISPYWTDLLLPDVGKHSLGCFTSVNAQLFGSTALQVLLEALAE